MIHDLSSAGWNSGFRRSALRLLCLLLFIFSALGSFGVQQAWVTKYNNGAGTTNQALHMGMDSDGNIYVAGHSTRTAAPFDYDYVVIKYNSLGVQQ